MEKEARLLLARADGLDGVAHALFSRAIHSKFSGKPYIGEIHDDNAERVRLKAAVLRRVAARLMADALDVPVPVQPIAEPVGREAVAV